MFDYHAAIVTRPNAPIHVAITNAHAVPACHLSLDRRLAHRFRHH
ncbi:hypothetical protein [Dinoroseobacter sp. S124A]